ncbi:uncharacterized protein LOC144931348 isoform X1 [Lampetra fluviatilis]
MGCDAQSIFAAWTALMLVSAASSADPEAPAVCGATLLEVEGELSSPGHPGPYPDRAACRWNLPARPRDRTAFRLIHLDIEYEAVCAFDRLAVSFGERGAAGAGSGGGGGGGGLAPHRIYCGSNISLHVQPFVGTGPATVLFHSDDSVTRTGFRLHYEVLQEDPPCASQPCGNGARCTNRLLGGFACVCAHGFLGATCDQEVNECVSSPCHGSGECVDLPGRFACVCRQGRSGQRCEFGTGPRDDDEWGLCQPNPCHHGGTCQSSRRQFHCLCPRNYTGSLCQHVLDSAGLAALLASLAFAFCLSAAAVTLCQLKLQRAQGPAEQPRTGEPAPLEGRL